MTIFGIFFKNHQSIFSSQYTIIFLENKQKSSSKEISCKIKRKFHTVKCLSLILSMKDIKKSFIYLIFIHFGVYGFKNETEDMMEC